MSRCRGIKIHDLEPNDIPGARIRIQRDVSRLRLAILQVARPGGAARDRALDLVRAREHGEVGERQLPGVARRDAGRPVEAGVQAVGPRL